MAKLERMRAIVLAGGKGTRLWPLSRENYPKQFVEFINGQSLFQLTLKRLAACFKDTDISIITSQEYKFHTVNQIETAPDISKRTKNTLLKNIVLEPCPRSTAPAIMLALCSLKEQSSDNDIFFVFPSDHLIHPLGVFRQDLKKAAHLAKRGRIVIFGVRPDAPNTGYGHIQVGKRIGEGFEVAKFIEKPTHKKLKLLSKEKLYWNAGIFAFKRSIFAAELQKHAPSIFVHSLKRYEKLVEEFRFVPQDSIDYAIMQKTKKACVILLRASWTDLGSWESVLKYFSRGKSNVSIGKAEFLETEGSFAFSRDKLISLLGLKDILVVEDSDSILVTKKGYSDKVKVLTQQLKKKSIDQVRNSLTVYRPWGYYTILKEKKNYKVKEIGIYPKKYVSLQKHRYRSEHWNLVEGKAEVIVDNKKTVIRKNESIFVPKGIKHKIYNPTNTLTVIIEVQIGSYLGEDDIRRYSSY